MIKINSKTWIRPSEVAAVFIGERDAFSVNLKNGEYIPCDAAVISLASLLFVLGGATDDQRNH